MTNDDVLRAKARELIQAGRLPDRSPGRVWGGSGLGNIPCALCGELIRCDEVALELELRRADGSGDPNLHVRCLSLFEQALRDRDASPPAARFGRADAA
ncbi:MAG TPA: hypothetical protein VFB01_17255 [Burkholderiales bacterium]|nr:hypothetical protein [Burkholderiales bacterium]